MRNTPPQFDAEQFPPGPTAGPPCVSIYESASAPYMIGDVNELTPEEQLALFELELKSTDSGHQPC